MAKKQIRAHRSFTNIMINPRMSDYRSGCQNALGLYSHRDLSHLRLVIANLSAWPSDAHGHGIVDTLKDMIMERENRS